MGGRELNRHKECLASAGIDTISLYFRKDDGMRVSFSIHGLRFDMHSVPAVAKPAWVRDIGFCLHNDTRDNLLT